jgi:hypothetical protein
MNIKRVAFIGLLVVFVIILSILWQRSQQKSPPPPVQSVITAPQPSLPPPIATGQPTYQLPATTPGFPQTLPVYTAGSPPQLKTVGSSFSLSQGINATPQEIPSTQGTIYVWTENRRSVVVNEGLSTISFDGGIDVGGTINQPPETYYASADLLLAPLKLSNQVIQLTRAAPQYFQPNAGGANEVNSVSQATSVQLNYQYTINGVPIYMGTSTQQSVFVRLNAKAEVITLTARILPSFTETNSSVPLVPYVDAAQALLRGEGRLTDLVSGSFGDQPYYFDSPPQISNIQDVELAYYYSTGQNQLIPVYAFKGTGKINNRPVQTTTLVSAVK